MDQSQGVESHDPESANLLAADSDGQGLRGRPWAVTAGIAAFALTLAVAASGMKQWRTTTKDDADARGLLLLAPFGYAQLAGECGGQIPSTTLRDVSVEQCAEHCDKHAIDQACQGFSFAHNPNRCVLHSASCTMPWSSVWTFYQKVSPKIAPDLMYTNVDGCIDNERWTNFGQGGCLQYAQNKWCNGTGGNATMLGRSNHFPERQCCVCGGGAWVKGKTEGPLEVMPIGVPLLHTQVAEGFDRLDELDLMTDRIPRGAIISETVEDIMSQLKGMKAWISNQTVNITMMDNGHERFERMRQVLEELKKNASSTREEK